MGAMGSRAQLAPDPVPPPGIQELHSSRGSHRETHDPRRKVGWPNKFFGLPNFLPGQQFSPPSSDATFLHPQQGAISGLDGLKPLHRRAEQLQVNLKAPRARGGSESETWMCSVSDDGKVQELSVVARRLAQYRTMF